MNKSEVEKIIREASNSILEEIKRINEVINELEQDLILLEGQVAAIDKKVGKSPTYEDMSDYVQYHSPCFSNENMED